ncbi:MAG: hemoglobin/transferrin/lactoferrin receptor protein [Saprospiraceae bacterium]|jgi:hemoglobin/transferrin/lactoferrin receptor protein
MVDFRMYELIKSKSSFSMRRSLFVMLLLLFTFSVMAQIEVSVVNEDNMPMPYVDVYTSDFSFTDVTNAEGKVIIPEGLSNAAIIVFNFLGYQEISKKKSELTAGEPLRMTEGLVLEEVTMVGRTDNRSRDLPGKVESINTKIFQLTNPQTAADALGQHADVYIQKSQMGGGSPVIRGFEANKVLLVLDGVRMNNAIFRSGHLQSAITVDNAMLERLEVLYGPGSLIYGSDAIGGVVHFRSKNPKLNFDNNRELNIFGNSYVRYASANNEKSAHIDFNIGGEKFGSLTSISTSDYGDLRTGSRRGDEYPDFGKRLIYADRIDGEDVIVQNEDPNLQVGTGYSQVDVLQKFLYQPNRNVRLIANLQYSTSTDVPRYDALSELDGAGLSFAEWYYGPQTRFFSSLRTDIKSTSVFTDKFILIAAYQKIDEDRIDRQFGSVNLDRQEEDLDVFSVTADLHKYFDREETFEINYGAEYNKNILTSSAFRTNIETNEVTNNILTRYPSGGGETDNIAAYALIKKGFAKFDLFGGLRYSSNGLDVKYLESDNLPWPEEYYAGISTRNNSLSWSLGTAIKPILGWKISSQVSSAFRSPNIDDLAKIRVRADEIQVPNIGLGPETSLNGELTIAKQISKHTNVSATGFYTKLSDAIIRDDFTLPDGTSFLVDEGDTLNTVSNINANSAKVTGISMNLNTSINEHFSFSGSFNYIKGLTFDEADDESPLSHIPPIYGKVSATYSDTKQKLNLNIRYNGEKPVSLYGGSADNLENATPDGTPPWMTVNLYYQRQLVAKFSASIGLENILDVHYRPFASGVSAPGRNLVMSINGKF